MKWTPKARQGLGASQGLGLPRGQQFGSAHRGGGAEGGPLREHRQRVPEGPRGALLLLAEDDAPRLEALKGHA